MSGLPEPCDAGNHGLDASGAVRHFAESGDSGRLTREWDLVLAVAVGGVLGAQARYGLGVAFAHRPAQLPWSTVLINASGCLAIGVLMAVLNSRAQPSRLARPFLGIGILGGYTTYSSFATDAVRLIVQHRPGPAAGYLTVTILSCAIAVWLGTEATAVVITITRARASTAQDGPA